MSPFPHVPLKGAMLRAPVFYQEKESTRGHSKGYLNCLETMTPTWLLGSPSFFPIAIIIQLLLLPLLPTAVIHLRYCLLLLLLFAALARRCVSFIDRFCFLVRINNYFSAPITTCWRSKPFPTINHETQPGTHRTIPGPAFPGLFGAFPDKTPRLDTIVLKTATDTLSRNDCWNIGAH